MADNQSRNELALNYAAAQASAFYRATYREPPPRARILSAVKGGHTATVGEMLKNDPGLVCTTDSDVSVSRYMYSQKCPLAIVAEDHGQKTLSRAIGIFEATGIWSPSGQWPHVRREVTTAVPEPGPGPELVKKPARQAVQDPQRLLPAAALKPAA